MNIKNFKKTVLMIALSIASSSVHSQQTYMELEQLTMNEQVTTVVTASEPIRWVDISTQAVVGSKPIENVFTIKPKDGDHEDGEILAIVTVVTERYRSQYALIYTSHMEEAVSDKEIALSERHTFRNPAVSMSTEDMVKFSRRIWNSPAKYRNVSSNHHRMTMRLNNIYSVGDYFFIDFSVENKTNLRFDMDQLRFKLSDKRQQKSVNNQIVELSPVFILEKSKRFLHGYRNVVVLKKMTFPNDKVLTIEMSEEQISGRTLSLMIDYEDVLAADTFDDLLLNEE